MLAVLGASWLLCGSAFASTIDVNTTSDELSADGHCSLREALTAANNDAAPFGGAGECTAGSGDDTIVLSAGTFALGIAGRGEDANATGDLDVLGPVTITGAGTASTTIDAHGIDRVLDVKPGRTTTIRGVTIRGGATQTGAVGADHVASTAGASATGGTGQAGEPGGGILNAGALTVVDSAIVDNATGAGGKGGGGYGAAANGGTGGSGVGGLGGHGGDGAGVFSTGSVTLTRSIVASNATGPGGEGGIGLGGDGGPGSPGGAGGQAVGGHGGRGGEGGGVAESGGGIVTAEDSSITGNQTGTGGAGGCGCGGFGGHGSSSGSGGAGGHGQGGLGGLGGPGGGIATEDTLHATADLVTGNVTGAGGMGGIAEGGGGGTGGSSAGSGGTGGNANANFGGDGGAGAGIWATGTGGASITNDTVTANTSGAGGQGGQAFGGQGGAGGTGGTGGTGGNAAGGPGGARGQGTAVGDETTATLLHATVTSNHAGSEGSGGTATVGAAGPAGSGGSPGSPGTTATTGGSGTPTVGDGAIGNDLFPGPNLPTATFQNTIVAANDTPSCGLFLSSSNGGHDIVFPDATCPGASVDPLLAALADNGGPTRTQALQPGSPAIDAVPSSGAGCAATDQRLVSRPQGAACDVGAYEHAPPDVTTGDAVAISSGGATIQGQVVPNARATSYHFELGTTTAYGTSTPSQDAGTGVAAVDVSAPVAGLAPATTYHYRLVASNSDGTAAGADRTFTTTAPVAGAASDTQPPAFLSASLQPKVFAVNRSGRAEVAVSARVKKGTTFRYTLSEPARVVFTIERVLPGRKVGHVCRKPTAANRRRHACKRYSRVGRFAAAATGGANSHRFSGRIGNRSLKPGNYRATLVATDAAGNPSAPKRLGFKIVRR